MTKEDSPMEGDGRRGLLRPSKSEFPAPSAEECEAQGPAPIPAVMR